MAGSKLSNVSTEMQIGSTSDNDAFPLGGPQDLFYSPENKGDLPTIVRAKGIYMWDDCGRRMIDVSSGPIISNIGHGDVRVGNAMARQVEQLDFAYSRVARHQWNTDLANCIATLAGAPYERVCFASGGSEAMEVAIRFARQYAYAKGQKQRTKLISLMPSYHGATLATTGLSGDVSTQEVFADMAEFSEKISAPFTYRLPKGCSDEKFANRTADELEQKIHDLGPENVLAFVVEPIGGVATGANVPPDIFFRRIRDICTHNGVLLIFDEVMCGAGRTGKFLAARHWPDALPDIVVLAKGIGAGYTPLGAMLAPAKMVDELASITGFNYSFTYNANPVSCAAGLAVLEIVEKENLVQNAEIQGNYLITALRTLATQTRLIGDIRGKGLLLAVELVKDKDTKQLLPVDVNATTRIRDLGRKHGLMIYSRRTNSGKYGEWFMVSPPMTITTDEIDEIISRLKSLLEDFESELTELGVIEKLSV